MMPTFTTGLKIEVLVMFATWTVLGVVLIRIGLNELRKQRAESDDEPWRESLWMSPDDDEPDGRGCRK